MAGEDKRGAPDLDQVVAFETEDGSTTLFDQVRGVHYRSHHGAVSESRYVFLGGTGLLEREGEWRVAELGFGAAVNFTQTVRAFREAEQVERLIYHSVDWRTVTPEHLDFHEGEGGELARQAAAMVHARPGEVAFVESQDERIALYLHPLPWEEVEFGEFRAQAFFQDPFSIRVNPEAWTAEYFRWARQVLEEDGFLATYSAATAVKRALFEAQFWVASMAGPGRKREMTVASPAREALEGRSELTLLERSRYIQEEE